MKKSFFLLGVLLLSMLGVACGTETELEVYEYSGMNDDTLYFDYSGETYRFETMERTAESKAEEKRTFQFMGEEYELIYSETDAKEFLPYAEDYYYAGDIEFAFVENTDKLAGICCYNGTTLDVSKSMKKNLSEEKDYRNIADGVVKEYIDQGKYMVECSTRVTVFEEKAGVAECSYENYDYFYKKTKDTEEINYTFTYKREFKGYETCEMVYVTLDADGRLCNFQLNAVGLFDERKDEVVKRKNIDKKIKQKLETICRKEYAIKEMEYETILCVNQEGNYFYVAMVDSVVENVNEETENEIPCVFILADE